MAIPCRFAPVLVLSLVASVFAADGPSAEQLLNAYQKSTEEITQFRIESSEKQWITGSSDRRFKDNRDDYVGVTERVICHDGPRWRFSSTRTNRMTIGGSAAERKSGTEYLVGDYLQKRQALRAQWMSDPEDFTKMARLNVWLDDHNDDQIDVFLGTAEITIGHVQGDGDRPVWDVVRDGLELEVLPEMETVGGAATYVVRSRGRFGRHTLWLDPEAGGLPRRIEIDKQPGHLFSNTQLGVETTPRSAKQAQGLPPGFLKKRILEESHQLWDKIQIEKRQGIFVITAFDTATRTTMRVDDNVEKSVTRIEYRTSVVDLDPATWPPSAFLPRVEIPNGTRVTTRDPQAPAVWIDGKVEKVK